MIEALIQSADYTNDPFVNEFGMAMNLRMVELDGRVLPAPGLDFGTVSDVYLPSPLYWSN